MKLAVAIAGETALDSAFVVWRGFESSIKKAAEFGYDGVELALRHGDEIRPEHLRELLQEYHMEVSCISTGQVYAETGLYFTDQDPGRIRELTNTFKGLIRLAAEFGGMVNLGRVRGRMEAGEDLKQTKECFYQRLRPVAEYAAGCGVTLVIEPVNRYEINFINSVDEGAVLLDEFRMDGVGLMPDVFHMNIEDDHIGDSLARNRKHVKYIHLADSNRLAPGWGHLNFEEVFHALREIRYEGWAAVEILPKPEPDSAARQAVEYLRQYMGR